MYLGVNRNQPYNHHRNKRSVHRTYYTSRIQHQYHFWSDLKLIQRSTNYNRFVPYC